MISYRTLFWDLDGTLTDPKEGITRSVQYALERLGIEVLERDELVPFIGPPLLDSFQRVRGLSETDARRAVAFYRERFTETGIFENLIYPGIAELLRDLQAAEVRMAVATSKPTESAERILVHFGIRGHFQAVYGADLEGGRSRKLDVLREATRAFAPFPMPAAMIGDHALDIEAAHACGVDGIAALYGYGAQEEVAAQRPTHGAKDVPALRRLLLP